VIMGGGWNWLRIVSSGVLWYYRCFAVEFVKYLTNGCDNTDFRSFYLFE
jgi:hypothetical protein